MVGHSATHGIALARQQRGVGLQELGRARVGCNVELQHSSAEGTLVHGHVQRATAYQPHRAVKQSIRTCAQVPSPCERHAQLVVRGMYSLAQAAALCML